MARVFCHIFGTQDPRLQISNKFQNTSSNTFMHGYRDSRIGLDIGIFGISLFGYCYLTS